MSRLSPDQVVSIGHLVHQLERGGAAALSPDDVLELLAHLRAQLAGSMKRGDRTAAARQQRRRGRTIDGADGTPPGGGVPIVADAPPAEGAGVTLGHAVSRVTERDTQGAPRAETTAQRDVTAVTRDERDCRDTACPPPPMVSPVSPHTPHITPSLPPSPAARSLLATREAASGEANADASGAADRGASSAPTAAGAAGAAHAGGVPIAGVVIGDPNRAAIAFTSAINRGVTEAHGEQLHPLRYPAQLEATDEILAAGVDPAWGADWLYRRATLSSAASIPRSLRYLAGALVREWQEHQALAAAGTFTPTGAAAEAFDREPRTPTARRGRAAENPFTALRERLEREAAAEGARLPEVAHA